MPKLKDRGFVDNNILPIKMGSKKYKSFKGAVNSVAKKKGLSKDRAAAYVATIDRKQHPKNKKKK